MSVKRQIVLDGIYNFKDLFRSEKTLGYITDYLNFVSEHYKDNGVLDEDDVNDDTFNDEIGNDVLAALLNWSATVAYACDGNGQCCRPSAGDATKSMILKSFEGESSVKHSEVVTLVLCEKILTCLNPEITSMCAAMGVDAGFICCLLQQVGLTGCSRKLHQVFPALLVAVVLLGIKLDFTDEEKDAVAQILFTFRRETFVGLLIEAGFQCLPLPEVVLQTWPEYFIEMQRFYRKTWKPRSLKRLAANAVHQTLKPFALTNIKTLMNSPEPPLPFDLASYVTFDWVDANELKRSRLDYLEELNDRIGLHNFAFGEEV